MAEAKDAKVWLDYTQQELDYNYDQRALVLNFQEYFDRYDADSKRVRAALDCRLDVSYGLSEIETLDIFPAGKAGAPVVLFIHGGAWTRQSKDVVSYPAEHFVAAGANFIAINFGLVPAVTLDEQIRQARAAIAWTYREAAGFGADPERLYVVGHSSGAHVTGMTMVTDWDREFGLPRDVIKGAMAFSGMYELEPVRLSARNEYMKLDHDAVDRNSSIRHIPDDGPPLIIGCGGAEHEEFRRQTKAFAEAWRAAGRPCQEFDLPGLNHFDVSFEFVDPKCPAMIAMLQMMKL
jgi:arylformamidase